MDLYIYRLTRFIILLICLIPSIICFLLVFFFLLKTKQISPKHLHNHVILVLLSCNFILITTELPLALIYSYQGYAVHQNDRFCSFWVGYNYGLYVVGLFLMAFGSIERYFLVFHERFVRQWRFILHYPPIVFCFIYPLMFYNMIINLYPCKNRYLYDSYVCGGACYQFQLIAGAIDYIINAVIPTILITLSSMVLLFRVIYQKRAMTVANTWRKIRLMCVQLISISMLYFFIWIPFVVVSLIRLFYDPFFLDDFTILFMNYCLYMCPLASPFLSLIGLPLVRRRIFRMMRIVRNNENRVGPTRIIQAKEQRIIPRRQQFSEHKF